MTSANEPVLTRAQRAAAIERIHENIALRSGAGCGKTFVLARRFTELMMASRGENPLRRFVALTFTDKAALEMSQRVRDMLASLASRAKGDDRRKILGWLEDIDQARISTIHSFCSSLLRTHAVQAGVDPDFAVCSDKLTVEQMSADAVEQAVLEAVQEQRPEVARLLTGQSFERLAGQVRTLLDSRTGWQAGQYALPEATLKRWGELVIAKRHDAWSAFEKDSTIASAVAQLRSARCSDSEDKLFSLVAHRLAVIGRMLQSPCERTPQAFALLAEKIGSVGSDKAWGGKGAAKAVRHGVSALAEAVKPYAIHAEDIGELDRQAADALATLVMLAQRAVEIYATVKRRRGLLDFTDLLHYSHRLLSSHSEVRRAVRGQIDQLLIDECQDTDAFQVAMLSMAIFADDTVAGELPPGKLFFVGDAKQSIYRFRGAQVEVFEELCRQVGAGRQIGLDLSFRTHQAGVAFANMLFVKLMGRQYAPIEAKRAFHASPDRGATVEILLAEPAGRPVAGSADATEVQAAATASRIAEMLAVGEKLVWDKTAGKWRAVQARDVAVLFARMTNSLVYERELARRGIPYYVVAGTGFFRRQEVFDVLNILQCIDNPRDDMVFFGTLRSSLVGMDDNALAHIAAQFQPPYLPKMFAAPAGKLTIEGLDELQMQAMRLAVDLIGRLNRIKDAIGIDELIRCVLDATGFEAVLLSQFNGRRMLGNVRMLIEQARSASAGAVALADFVNQMRQRVMDESRYEQAAVACEGENVVRIMTIHKAKGLEFPVVFLPDLNVGRRGFRDSLLNRTGWGLTYKLRPADDDAEDADENGQEEDSAGLPITYRLACKEENTDAAAEDVRRFYVAVTRHEDHLVLVGANWRKKDGALRAGGSYVRMTDDVLGVSAAIEAGRQVLTFGPDDAYQAIVRKYVPADPAYSPAALAPGREAIDAARSARDLIGAICSAGGKPAARAALIGPLPPDVGRAEIAVTAMGDFAQCPMLYRWRRELRVPCLTGCGTDVPAVGLHGHDGSVTNNSLDAATLGTLLHGCMENLDFAQPQEAIMLVAAQAQEMSLADTIDAPAVAEEFAAMLTRFRMHPLWNALAVAKQIYRELDFVMDISPAILRGQIDLMYEDSAGAWHIVDYKSDRIGDEGVGPHAQRYRTQMLIYAAAAERYNGATPADTTLYFLRTGQASTLAVTPEMLASAKEQAGKLAKELIACRRAGNFTRRATGHCNCCQYRPLCSRVVKG